MNVVKCPMCGKIKFRRCGDNSVFWIKPTPSELLVLEIIKDSNVLNVLAHGYKEYDEECHECRNYQQN